MVDAEMPKYSGNQVWFIEWEDLHHLEALLVLQNLGPRAGATLWFNKILMWRMYMLKLEKA